ncbi:MAG: Ig-like domain-containing protein [Myxococcales bacterium]
MSIMRSSARLGTALFIAVALGGWGWKGGCDGDSRVAIPSLSVDRASGVLADGEDSVTLTFAITDSLHASKVFANEPVRLLVTGTGNDVTPGSTLMTEGPQGRATFHLSSTVAETKTITVVEPGFEPDSDPSHHSNPVTVEFVPTDRPPHRLGFRFAPGTLTNSDPLPVVEVLFFNEQGRIFPSNAAVTLSLENGPFAPPADPGATPAKLTVAAVSGVARFEGGTFCAKTGVTSLIASVGSVQERVTVAVLGGEPKSLVFQDDAGNQITSLGEVQVATDFGFYVGAMDACVSSTHRFTGTAHFSSTDPSASLPPDREFILGHHRTSFVGRFNTVGDFALEVESPSVVGATASVHVVAGAASALTLSALPDPVVAGDALDLTVGVVDAKGYPASPPAGEATFESTDPSATLPPAGFTGSCTGCVVFRTPGAQTLTARWGTLTGSTATHVQ